MTVCRQRPAERFLRASPPKRRQPEVLGLPPLLFTPNIPLDASRARRYTPSVGRLRSDLVRYNATMITAQDRAIEALCTKFDPHATKALVLGGDVGPAAIDSALNAGHISLSENGKWVAATTEGLERWNEIRPQPKSKAPSRKRDLYFEESLIRAEVAVTLLEKARPGQAGAEARRTLNEVAAEMMRSYLQERERPALYSARCAAVDRALDRLI